MTLIEKVQELQAIQPPLDPTEMKRRIEDWKTSTNYKDPNARIEAKGDTAVAEKKDTTATVKKQDVSESGIGSSKLDQRATRGLEKITLQTEQAVVRDARRNLEKSAEFVVDFNKYSKTADQDFKFKDISGDIIDTSKVEEEKIPAPFTQERKDYYDANKLAYDNTIIKPEQEAVITDQQKIDKAVKDYTEATGKNTIRLSTKEAFEYGLIPEDTKGVDVEYSFEKFLLSPKTKQESLELLNKIKQPDFFAFDEQQIQQQGIDDYFKLKELKSPFKDNLVSLTYNDQKELGLSPKAGDLSKTVTYGEYLKLALGDDKYKDYTDYKQGNFQLNEKNISDAVTKLQQEKINQFMYGSRNDDLRFAYAFYDEDISERRVEDKEITQIEKSLEKEGQRLETISQENQKEITVAVNEVNSLLNKTKKLKGKVEKFEESMFFSAENPAYKQAIEDYNLSIKNYNEAYTEYVNSEIGQKAKTLSQDSKVYEYRINRLKQRAEAYNEDPTGIIEKALGLDYTATAKLTNSLYNTFIKDTKNFLNLSAGTLLDSMNTALLSKGLGYSFTLAQTANNIEKSIYDYNSKLAAWTDANIAPSLKLDDIGKEGVGFFDYAVNSLADQSGTILLGLSYLGTGGLSASARLASNRIVANTFFAVEAGSSIGESVVEKYDARKQMEFYNNAIESGQYTDIQLEEMGLDIDELKRKSNYVWNQMSFNALLAGTTAKYAEKLGTLRMPGILKNAATNRGIKNVLKTKIYKTPLGLKYLYAKGFGKNVYQGLRPLATKAVPGELLEETLTEISHNVLDYYVLGENKSFLEGVDADFFTSVGLSSLAMMGPGSMQNIFSSIKNDFRSLDDLSANTKLRNRLYQLDLLIPKLEGSRRLQAKKEKRNILRKFAFNEVSTLQKLNKLTPDQIFEIAEASRMQRELAEQARLIGQEGKTDAESRNEINKLNTEYKNLQNIKDNLLNTKKRQMALAAKNMREQMGAPSAIDLEYNLGIYDMALNSAEVLMNKNGNFIQIPATENGFPTKQEIVETLKQNGYNDAKANSLADQLTGDAPVNALQDGNNIIINDYAIKARIYGSLNNADAEYAAVAPIEEIFHANVKSKNLRDAEGNLSDEATTAINDTIKILKQNKDNGVISEKDYNDLLDRFELYKDSNGKVVLKSGERGAAKVDIEEVMAQMNNANVLGKIDASALKGAPSIRMFLNSVISNIMGDSAWLIDLKNSNDVLNFLDTFKKRYEARNILVDAEEEANTTPVIELQTDVEVETQVDQPLDVAASRGQEFINLYNEGVYNNESLVEIINSSSSNQTDRFAAMEAIVETNWPVISKGLKFNPTGSIPMDAVKTAVTEQMQGIFPGRNKELLADFNPETAQVNTYLGSLMGQRQAEILERAKQIGGVTLEGASIDSDVARQVVDTTTKETPTKRARTPKTPTETVKYSDAIIEKAGVKDKAELETKITEATTESFKDVEVDRFGQTKDVPQAVAEIYGDMLGLNPETITDKTRTYQNYDEAGLNAAQRFLLANAASDYARLPKTKDETTTRGRGTFIPKNMKDALYTDGKLTGTLKDYMDLLRSKPTGPLYRDSKYAQLIRGLLNTHIRNRMFETLVPTTPQRLRGGAKFSKGQKITNIFQETTSGAVTDGFNAYNFNYKNILNQILKDTGVSKIDMSTKAGRKRFLKFAVDSGAIKRLPPSFWISLGYVSQTALTNETKEELKAEGVDLRTVTAKDDTLGTLREYKGNLPFKNSTEARQWIAKTGKENFAKETEAFKDMLKQEDVFTKKGNLAVALNNAEFKKRQENSINELKKVFEIFQNEIMRNPDGTMNFEGVAFIGALLSSSSAGRGHFLRKAAPFKFYQKGYIEAGTAKTTLEHTMPATIVGKYLFMQALNGSVLENFNNIKKNYFQGALLKVDDNKLKGKKPNKEAFNYVATMPEGWKVTDNVWARYFNINVAKTKGGINPSTIILAGNKSIFDTFNITSSGLILNNETKNQMPKVEALNASSQPTVLIDSQASTQQQVYNQSVLDNALNEGRKLDAPVKKFEVKQETLNDLGLSTPQQIAIYVAEQASKGFNSFTFDEASLGKLKSVKDILSQIDINSKTQKVKANKGKAFNTIINDMIESSSGIESYKKFSAAKAKTIGRDKGRFDFMTLASSAEDFKGLLYRLLGDGKQGEAQYEFLKTNLIDPYNRAEDAIVQAKISAANDFMALKEQFKGLPKTLETETGVGKFTYQHALRTYMWTTQGMSIPGLSKADARKLNKFITDDAQLQAFADQLISIQKGKPYPEPGKDWLGGNLTTDIIGGINKVNRAEYQQQWRENVEIIFSPKNLNKMEAAYGTRWRKALENSLKRMKAGTNRLGYNDATSNVLDWVNNSVGAVMFLNTRSAVLQTISAVNFINWGDNNIIKAGAAFANQKQFWSDFMTLMNSDYLTQRRNGLKINVSESEIADAVKDSKNKVKAAIAYLLSKGFVFTRYADSFAIASGGATFYRNRIKKYLKEGMSQELAQEKAFNDFRDIAEESQQSSSPDKISMQQASAAGRVILNWANTPMQYVRIQKRSLQDLIAGRGDAKVHISRIAYYGVMQNLIFNALQQALFAIGFGDDDEDKAAKKKQDEKKIARVANGMIDSQLKGLGIAGAAMVAAKNTIMKIYEESGKNRPEFEKAAIEALSFSPAISSKYRKIVGGLKSFSWNRKEMKEKGFSLDNPAYLAGAQIITAVTNIPIDRVIKKANNIRGIMSEQSQMWQKVSMSLGWSAYDVGLPYYGGWDKPKEPTEAERKKQEIKAMKLDTNTSEQTQMLLDLGLTKKQIKALRYEDARVKKIIELQKKKKDATSRK